MLMLLAKLILSLSPIRDKKNEIRKRESNREKNQRISKAIQGAIEKKTKALLL